MRSLLVVLGLCVVGAGTAHADAKGRAEYPEWLSDRPLVLPTWTGQAALELDIGSTYHGSAGVGLGMSGDVGLPHRLQVGAAFVFPIFPGPQFGAFDFALQYNVMRELNVRLDLGAMRTSIHIPNNFLGPDDSHIDGFVAGFGLPYKVRVHKMISIIGGRPTARAAIRNPVINAGHGNRLYGYGFYNEDVLSVLVDGEKNGVQAVIGALYLPIGVEAQPLVWISFNVRIGYRLLFGKDVKGNADISLLHFIPLELGVSGHPHRLVDVGFTATLYGPIASSNESDTDKVYKHYSDVRSFDIWVAGRF